MTDPSSSAWLHLERWLDEEPQSPFPGEMPPEPEMPEFYRELKPCSPPREATVQRVTLAEARQQIARAMVEYAARPLPEPPERIPILLVAATPGLGKTTAAVRFAEQQADAGQHVLYAGPRHDFFSDILRITKRPELWYEWLPRQVGDDEHRETCPYATECNLWISKGYRGMAFCKSVCGWDYVNDTCAYHAQKNRPEPIIFGMHEHVTLGHPKQFHIVIGDESPIDKFCDQWTIPPRFIFPLTMPESDFRGIVIKLAEMCQSGMKLWDKPLFDALGGPADVLAACQSFTMTEDILEPEIHQASDAANADYGHLPHLALALKREAKRLVDGAPIIPRVEVAPNGLTLYRRHKLNPKLPEHVIWLDATANRKLYEQVFQRGTLLVRPKPKMEGRFYQLYQRAYNKGAIYDKKGKAMRLKPVDEAIATIKHISKMRGYRQVGVISFKDLEAHIIKNLPGAVVGHFYAARGTNEFEGCDGLFIVGTPQPDQEALPRSARMIYLDRDDPFRTAWSERRAPYNYVADDGQGRDYPVSGYWDDRDLHEVLAATRDEEILQAAHRARPLHRKVDVWLLNNVPHPSLALDGLYTYAEALGAPEKGLNVFLWPQIVKIAEEAEKDRGEVVPQDYVSAMNVSIAIGLSYVRMIAKQPRWSLKVSAVRDGKMDKATRQAP